VGGDWIFAFWCLVCSAVNRPVKRGPIEHRSVPVLDLGYPYQGQSHDYGERWDVVPLHVGALFKNLKNE